MKNNKQLFDELSRLDTEQDNPDSASVDTASPLEIARIMNAEDAKVALAVQQKLEEVAAAITLVANAFKQGGRLIYAGSGSSGRTGVIDAAECPPTFGTGPKMVTGIIAGGPEAMFKAKEGAEDDPQEGARDIESKAVGPNDVVCGLAASGRTPYVLGALQKARSIGAKTIFVCCVTEDKLPENLAADIIIAVSVGAEVISGSTRLKSGTAQKMVCNMITTGAMIGLGKVYQNVMVDLQLTNMKLHERARRILMKLSGISYEQASELLEESGNHVKTSLVMAIGNKSAEEAGNLLREHNGFVRTALESIGNTDDL